MNLEPVLVLLPYIYDISIYMTETMYDYPDKNE